MTRGSACSPLVLALFFGCAQRVAPTPATAQPAQPRSLTPTSAPLVRSATPSSAEPPIQNSALSETTASSSPSEPSALGQTIALDVPDFSPAVVRLPDSLGKAPVLVVTHGAGGTPEAHCELWARISRGKAILLCVRGRARSPLPADGDYYPDHPTLERETFAALSALRARFADRIAGGPVFYAGFSQGATMGARMLVEHASEVTRLVLVEGGFSEWNIPRARDFRARGGERVLFVCGRKECAEPARNAAHWFKDAGVAAQVEYVRGAGHSHDARVEARIAALYPWFIEGDARWQTDDSTALSARTPK
jgi:pimeloyl-ACP methyl ester carboxylesterase